MDDAIVTAAIIFVMVAEMFPFIICSIVVYLIYRTYKKRKIAKIEAVLATNELYDYDECSSDTTKLTQNSSSDGYDYDFYVEARQPRSSSSAKGGGVYCDFDAGKATKQKTPIKPGNELPGR